ncbi:gliding motility lipoprotein GldJ [Psychroflexus sp. CCL10W]|nr:gliding motility lipoprotein GldJ [Psychroflexus montanilacus]MBZ9652530.1 gliding motility lipoprotein GldJ [Psychroflexus montanilacus]
MKNFVKSCMLVTLAILVTGCNNSRDYKSNSRATGWDLSGRDGGVSYKTDYEEQEPGPGLLFVEGGTFTMGRVQDDVMHDWNNTPTQQHVQSFYIDETEVTNVMYLEYLDWLKQVFPPSEERYKNIYTGALPDTLVWRNPLGFNENMVNNYLRHPAFHNYPVVGVNWIQATEFSQWRTDRVNEKRLSDKGYTSRDAYKNSTAESVFSTETYLNSPDQVYGGDEEKTKGGRESDRKAKNNNPDEEPKNLYVQRKDGELLPAYRLPTEAEWEYAALGQSSLRDYNSYRGRKKYPWDGQYTRSGDRKTIGDQRANFKQGQGDYGGIAGWSDDGADITSEVKSYDPNDYGLYDMAGNVSEWVADVYRPRVDNEYNDFNYFRGNVYTKNAITEEGKVKVLTADEVVYDTLSNGKIVARNTPGEIAQVSIGEEETYLRTQFSISDNINYRDGDKSSSRYYEKRGSDGKEENMYNSPDNNVTLKDGQIDRRYDGSSSRTTLIDDNVRVYKGGSWRDREYWLDPAQRRYFPQDMATDDIGFRNAMSKVGSKSNKGRRTRN